MNRFSLIVGIIGLASFVLAIPLAIAANLLTPRVRDWWANSSKVRKCASIESLQRRIEELDSCSDSHALARFLRPFIMSVNAGLMMILTLALFISLNDVYIAARNGLKLDGGSVDLPHMYKFGMGLQVAVLVWEFLFLFSFRIASRRLREVSSQGRKEVRLKLIEQRDKLKTKLSLVDNVETALIDKPTSNI